MTEKPSGERLPEEGAVDVDTQPEPDREGEPEREGQPSDGGQEAPAELPDPEAQVRELTADLQRLQAEFLNYKRRVDRDRELVLQNAKLSILSSLLPVLDAIDRARDHGELEGGFKAVAESLEKVVEGQGLHKFGAPGDEFDPHHHEALMHGHSPDVKVPTCQNIVQAGYQIGERVVRPALVTVVDPEPGQERLVHEGDDSSSAPEPVEGLETTMESEAGAFEARKLATRPPEDE